MKKDSGSKRKDEFFLDKTPKKLDFNSNNTKTDKSINNESVLKKIYSTSLSTELSLNKHLSSSKFYSIQLDNDIREANEDEILVDRNMNSKFVKIDKNTLSRNKFNKARSTGVLPEIETSAGI